MSTQDSVLLHTLSLRVLRTNVRTQLAATRKGRECPTKNKKKVPFRFGQDNLLTLVRFLLRQVHLDLSSNKLRSLPAELGDMHTLRELLLHNNYLRVLPYELGRLFQLQTLGAWTSDLCR